MENKNITVTVSLMCGYIHRYANLFTNFTFIYKYYFYHKLFLEKKWTKKLFVLTLIKM